jgi:AcrR family transcriptional regulator
VTVDSRPYHHGDLRAALIGAGLDATREGGPTALGLRDVTRRVGVSANAAYRHFADRDALLDAVAEEIFRRVAARMAALQPRPSLPEKDAVLARLRAVGMGYIAFAMAEPGWFHVVFFRSGRPRDIASPPPPPYRALTDALDGLVEAGLLDATRRDGAQWVCWSAVHGFAELVLRGPLHGAPAAELDALAARTVDAIVAGVVGGP